MPKITITEKDYIKSPEYDALANVVYVPGFIGTKGTLDKNIPTLFRSVTEFENKVGTAPDTFDTGYAMAHKLLEVGAFVLYEVIEAVSELQVTKFWSKLEDKYKYNIRFLTAGGYQALAKDSMKKLVAQYMLAAAANRGDATALIDIDKTAVTAGEIKEIALTLKPEVGSTDEFNYLSQLRYGAAFAPWIKIDSTNSLPASFAYLRAYALSTANNPAWFAVAGEERGKCPFEPLAQFGQAEVEELQTRTAGDICVNPICNINPFGNIIWGNRTLAVCDKTLDFDNNKVIDEDDLVASNFLNIRQLISDIKKQMYFASVRYTFEQNSDILWINFKAMITPLLDKMLSGNGINGYKFIRVATDKKAKLAAKLTIIPVEAVEDFELTLELADTLEIEE